MKASSFRWQPLLAGVFATVFFTYSADAARVRHLPRHHAAVQTETFSVAKDARIAIGSNGSASLGDVRIGDTINIGYVQENGALVARHIADAVQHTAVHSTKSPETKAQHHAGMATLSHTHGIVRSVDVQAGTITIAHKR
jgi:Cu/Ag efflux protein CusF